KIAVGSSEVFIYSEDPLSILKYIITVFGVASIIPAVEVKTDIHEITSIGSQVVARRISRGSTFAVRVRGQLENLSFTSRDIEVCLSAEILSRAEEKGIENVKTSLRKPHIKVFVNVKGRKSYIYFEKYKGVGGLPYGIRGKILSIILGDIKSAISTWIMAREGYVIVPVQFSLDQYASGEYEARITNILRRLREYIPEEKLKIYLFNHTYSIEELNRKISREMICTVCRMIMYKVVEKLCKDIKANGIVVCEEYRSYKSNILSIDGFINVPIFKPLKGLSKYKIRRIAEEIGLYNDWEVQECSLTTGKYALEVDLKNIIGILEDINWISIVNKEYKTVVVKELK
ncbi:MAG: THUMP domain-containing protein, partial [Candidatus Methanomethylicia archaeon]